jgi:hypothetical protein
MSDDPETRRQISELSHGTRPLLVCDVDEVVLEFIRPFQSWLGGRGLHLKTDSFRLHGNIIDRETSIPVENARVSSLIEEFFHIQHDWQEPVDGAVEHLNLLSAGADIVLLTAMPHRYRDHRLELMAKHSISFPLITTEMAKGPAVLALRGDHARPVAFIDDIAHNHISVAQSVPDAVLIHLMAFAELLPVMPPLPPNVHMAGDWADAADKAAAHLGFRL